MKRVDEFRPNGLITLTTDFGLEDPFVGVMKGVILQRFADARIVDLTHGVRAQAVAEAGFWLGRSYRWFPSGSVHVAVVDPGVGTGRAALVVAAGGHVFLAPDNGLLSPVFAEHQDAEVREIDVARLGLPTPSRTFHGRDVFAPVAAMLASSHTDFAELGVVAESPVQIPIERIELQAGKIKGHVVCIDRFGNAITDISEDVLGDASGSKVLVGNREVPMGFTYADVREGECLALVNSFGCLEVAMRNGDAAVTLGLAPGDTVTVVSNEDS